MKERETWLDFIKIVACFLVVMLHTISYGLSENVITPSLLVYYIGTFAIPLFFMVNGYLQLRRKVSYKYVIKNAVTPLAGSDIIPILPRFLYEPFQCTLPLRENQALQAQLSSCCGCFPCRERPAYADFKRL